VTDARHPQVTVSMGKAEDAWALRLVACPSTNADTIMPTAISSARLDAQSALICIQCSSAPLNFRGAP